MILAQPVDLTPFLKTPGSISPNDVIKFRQEVFNDALVSKQEADALFMINDATDKQCVQWHEFYVEALTDFTVHQQEPRGYVSEENAEWLIRQVARDGKVKTANELEMLVKTLEKATNCPPSFVTSVLMNVADIIVSGEGELIYGKELTKGVIGEPEAELLRRILFAVSGDDGIGISRQEAEILFDLNDQTNEALNHPAWSDLFVKAIAHHLLVASGYHSPDRKTALAREKWLEDTEVDVAGSLKKSLTSFGGLFTGGFTDAFKTDHQRTQEAWADRNEGMAQKAFIAQAVDENEAQWLVERVGRDGKLHDNEKALIEFIKEDSLDIHPLLHPLLDKVA